MKQFIETKTTIPEDKLVWIFDEADYVFCEDTVKIQEDEPAKDFK